MTRKILLSSIAAAVVSMTAQAQTSDKSKMMNTAQSQTTEMTIKGLKVIFKPSAKQTVSAVMFFKGGTSNYGADQQGIESLALSATTECGTKKYNKDAFKDIADQYGVGLSGSSGYDFGTISMSCVKPYFSKGWELFADAVNAPVFEAKELGMLQQKLAANLKQEEGDPDSKLREMALSNTFANTRYAYRPSGTPESVTKFTQQDVSNYYNKTLLNRERMVLVIVGNLTAEEVKNSVEKAFGNIPQATAAPLKGPEALTITGNTLNTEDRKLATNYILGMMGAPESNSAAFNAYRLGMDILGDKLFEEVRTKRNLSYAPAAYATGGFHPYSVMYVTTTKPKEAVTVMVDEVKRLRNNGFTATDLRDAKNQFATSYFMKNESNGASAYALGTAEIKGSWKNEESFLEKINAVTLPEMQSVFNKYTDGIKWSYLGDASMADKAAFDKTTK